VTLKSACPRENASGSGGTAWVPNSIRNLYAEIPGGIEIVGVLMPVCFPSLC
jgi:hypothetical protein